MANLSGLKDYRLELGEEGKELRRTGAIEGNVDKLVARRMKNQGMSWSPQGIQRLLCVRFLVLEGKLESWLQEQPIANAIALPKKTMRRLVRKTFPEEATKWLQAGLPALRGPHSSHPWAYALRSLAQV